MAVLPQLHDAHKGEKSEIEDALPLTASATTFPKDGFNPSEMPGPEVSQTGFPTGIGPSRYNPHGPGGPPSSTSSPATDQTETPQSVSSDPVPVSTILTTAKPTAASDSGPKQTSTSNGGYGYMNPTQKQGVGHSSRAAVYAAAGVVPIVLIIFGALAFFLLRRRKHQRQQQPGRNMAAVREMKSRTQSNVRPFLATAPVVPASAAATLSYTAPPRDSPPASPAAPQPVILGPIVPGSNSAYYTGIDTSDVVSVTDRTGLGNPFADGNSLHEEPPPPYRPRSLAPVSRETSLRAPSVGANSQTTLIEERSPFADPEDDAVSVMSVPVGRRDGDTMSVVSDLSYQADPTTTRPTV